MIKLNKLKALRKKQGFLFFQTYNYKNHIKITKKWGYNAINPTLSKNAKAKALAFFTFL